MSNELKKIYPGVKYTLESGEEVTVSPVPFGKLMVFGEAVASLLNKVSGLGQDALKGAGLTSLDMGMVFSSAVEEVIELMALVLNKDRVWFDTITTADGLGLFNVILDQNLNEGTKKNIHAIAKTIEKQFLSTS